jgi:hypothetical protein
MSLTREGNVRKTGGLHMTIYHFEEKSPEVGKSERPEAIKQLSDFRTPGFRTFFISTFG